ncbi:MULTISPECIES: CAF17-like 4Fe-4S cluster assembly/insertion protein YgfZ [Cysteiniphilum]|uniref:Amino acid transporter n=1 Tax=Cysteiniphilum litorale TaxID=2056700 RepID=A0A8J3E666_9GAMM|nr:MULTISPECIES: folate-binding protein YgfZ [Cysteiniphilum]GGF87685.1 amino acid transporter [Cysteiniphilum litorale]
MAYYIYEDIEIIRVSGADCVKFLQGQLTNDVTLLNADNSMQLNALCNQKGRIIALFFMRFVAENDLLLALPRNLADQALQALRKYAVFSKISFETSDQYQLIYSQNGYEKSFLLQHAIVDVSQQLVSSLNFDKVQKENICQQLPMIDIHNSESFLPAELNLDRLDVISYQKGCFMGQEIIARMKYRGNLKKSLLSIEADKALPFAEKLQNVDGKNIADIVNQVNIDDKSFVLAVFNHAIENTPIILQGDIHAKIIA